MSTLIAEARARAASPAALIEKFRAHMAEHGLEIAGPVAESRIAFPGGAAMLRLEGGAIALRIEAADADRLAEAKATVAGHLDALAPGEALGIVWTGAGAPAGSLPHNFRAVRVLRAADVTPRMRRLTLGGRNLERFDAEMMHVKILIPAPGSAGAGPEGEPAWPRLDPSGQPVLDGCALTRRTYTIRRIDAAAGELDIDFVLHGDGSPGSRFAMEAQPGDWLGLTGPGGGNVPVRGWTLIAGDETALPAIARALEGMPPEARGLAIIEVADRAEEQALAHPSGVALRWLHRDGAPYGEMLLQAVLAADWPEESEVSAWAACESATARALRDHWGGERRLPRSHFRAVAYWRQGLAEGAGQGEHD